MSARQREGDEKLHFALRLDYFPFPRLVYSPSRPSWAILFSFHSLGFPLSLYYSVQHYGDISTGCLDTLSQPAILFFICCWQFSSFAYFFILFFKVFMCVVMVMKLNWNSSGEPVPRVEFACCLMLTGTREMLFGCGGKIYYDSAVDDDFFSSLSLTFLSCTNKNLNKKAYFNIPSPWFEYGNAINKRNRAKERIE